MSSEDFEDFGGLVASIAAKAKALGFVTDDAPVVAQVGGLAPGQWRALGVGERIVSVLGEICETAATGQVRQWLGRRSQRDPWSLVMCGPKGCGKSVAAALWMRELAPRPMTVWHKGLHASHPAWWPSAKLARAGGYDGVFDALCSHPGPIVIDDLGSEYLDGKGWLVQAIDGLMDARYADYLPTCITTNLRAQDFAARYGERVTDRLREGGVFAELKSESLRRFAR